MRREHLERGAAHLARHENRVGHWVARRHVYGRQGGSFRSTRLTGLAYQSVSTSPLSTSRPGTLRFRSDWNSTSTESGVRQT